MDNRYRYVFVYRVEIEEIDQSIMNRFKQYIYIYTIIQINLESSIYVCFYESSIQAKLKKESTK